MKDRHEIYVFRVTDEFGNEAVTTVNDWGETIRFTGLRDAMTEDWIDFKGRAAVLDELAEEYGWQVSSYRVLLDLDAQMSQVNRM
jgi:hypothetical protein